MEYKKHLLKKILVPNSSLHMEEKKPNTSKVAWRKSIVCLS